MTKCKVKSGNLKKMRAERPTFYSNPVFFDGHEKFAILSERDAERAIRKLHKMFDDEAAL